MMTVEDKHIADYFVISGISDDFETNTECKQLISPISPITDITVIFKSLGEECPVGYTCIETTPCGHSADLNNGNFKSQNILVCYKRGNDKPPLVDVGVYHEDKERVLNDVEVVYTTPYGRCASTGAIGSKSGTFVTYRRAKTRYPFNQLVVVDLCVILNNKGENPPHAFFPIRKNLNKSYYGMIGSEVFLCYKKTILSPPSICFTPQIISRFPLQDYHGFPLPETVPLFCLPAGAKIEAWPSNTPLSRPNISTFVLTSDSAQKIYGSSFSFYEPFDPDLLSPERALKLGLELGGGHKLDEESAKIDLYSVKSICILSRWPFFDCFEKFLFFLHRLVCNRYTKHESNSAITKSKVPLEHYISHFLLDVIFPTPQRPTVLVQLMPGSDETVTISQPSDSLPLPMTGASFCQLLSIMGVDNTLNLLLFGLCEQKILLHSLHPNLLTGIAEAMTAMLFPFHWQCPYVPLCPLSLHGILNAPLPFIVGIDSRCFDTFSPPSDIISIDLDTKAIYLSELKKCLNLRILPKRPARVLRTSLEKIMQRLARFQSLCASQPQSNRFDQSNQNIEKNFELEIREAFLQFMVTILRGFRSYLLPITSAPTVGATDPTSLFDFDGFLISRDRSHGQFYHLITKTQMFTHYIEERSFVSDKTTTSLAFFDDCEEKLCSSGGMFSEKAIRLFDIDNCLIQTDRSVYVPAPDQSPSVSTNLSSNTDSSSSESNSLFRFGPLNPSLFHRHPQRLDSDATDKHSNASYSLSGQTIDSILVDPKNSFSLSRRTKQEVRYSQKTAKKSSENPLAWSRYLVSCCFSMWFATLPSYIQYCRQLEKDDTQSNSKSTSRILRHAYSILVKMQKLNLNTDEICFRVLTLLCGHYGQPALAVRVFFEMKKAGIRPNTVTYGYYNKAVLESKWPEHSSNPTTILWVKIRNVLSGISMFKLHGKLRRERLSKDMNSDLGLCKLSDHGLDDVDRSSCQLKSTSYFHPTTTLIEKSPYFFNKNHRRSFLNKSFHSHQKSSLDIHDQENDANIARSAFSIHKSHSMHLRNESPERPSEASRGSSSSSDDEEEYPFFARSIQPTESCRNRRQQNIDNYEMLIDKMKILIDDSNTKIRCQSEFNLSAGILFTTTFDGLQSTKTAFISDNQKESETIPVSYAHRADFHNISGQMIHSKTSEKREQFGNNPFAEDAKILINLDSSTEEPNLSNLILESTNHGHEVPNQTKIHDPCDLTQDHLMSQQDQQSLLKNITSTPNFKISSLINDASNLQWSKWTYSQNSKSVYKGIKSAATGLVSSLQEIKSSFSLSNANTPGKPVVSNSQRGHTTRDMFSEWAHYFSSQPKRVNDEDSDLSSESSNDLFKLSNDEDVDGSNNDECQYKVSHQLFENLEKHYNNRTSREDLIDILVPGKVSENQSIDDKPAMEISMTTCSKCTVCHSLLYDEEIMERWSYNDSNLNTRCIYCRAKIVPMMSIQVIDLRFDEPTYPSSAYKSEADDETKYSQANGYRSQESLSSVEESNDRAFNDIIVPYLSPIVLRKELESVFEASSDLCVSTSRFVDDHPIIFWNLLWYMNRINASTHLELLCLNSKIISKGRLVSEKWSNYRKVIVKTLWDNEKLHNEIGQPLYKIWKMGDPSTFVDAILCDQIILRTSLLNSVANLVRDNELQQAMTILLNARLKNSTKFSFNKNRHNLYRDLMFLVITSLDSVKFHIDNYERDYRKAFENLNFQQVALNRFDRPPTIGSLFCRRSFRELVLNVQ